MKYKVRLPSSNLMREDMYMKLKNLGKTPCDFLVEDRSEFEWEWLFIKPGYDYGMVCVSNPYDYEEITIDQYFRLRNDTYVLKSYWFNSKHYEVPQAVIDDVRNDLKDFIKYTEDKLNLK